MAGRGLVLLLIATLSECMLHNLIIFFYLRILTSFYFLWNEFQLLKDPNLPLCSIGCFCKKIFLSHMGPMEEEVCSTARLRLSVSLVCTWTVSIYHHIAILSYSNEEFPGSVSMWTKTLALTMTQPCEIELLYFTCIFLVTRPFRWYHNNLPCDIDLELWPTLENIKPWRLLKNHLR